MSISGRLVKLVIQLNKETSKGLVWSAVDAPEQITYATSDYIPLFFKTEYKQKNIVIYERKFKHFYDEFEFYWLSEIVIAILDDLDRVIWHSNEEIPALNDLFSNIREQCSGIDDMLDDLIDD